METGLIEITGDYSILLAMDASAGVSAVDWLVADESRGASVDDLIDDIDAVLDAYKGGQ